MRQNRAQGGLQSELNPRHKTELREDTGTLRIWSAHLTSGLLLLLSTFTLLKDFSAPFLLRQEVGSFPLHASTTARNKGRHQEKAGGSQGGAAQSLSEGNVPNGTAAQMCSRCGQKSSAEFDLETQGRLSE